ncbi:MAG: transposase [Patescibacteria group bacterium]
MTLPTVLRMIRIPPQGEITKEHIHTIDACPECHTPLTRMNTVIFYEEDIRLPEKPSTFKEVNKHTVEKGFCNTCKTWRPALPIPSTAVVIGPQVRSFVCYASVILRLSYEQITHILNDLYAFPLSQGEITYILEGEAMKLNPAYERLKQTIREQKGTHKEGLTKNLNAYFTCLLHEGIPPDNNKAERALRHLVLKHKISFGSCTQRGADTLSILASVLLSLWWRKPQNFFQEYMALKGV